MSKTKLASLKNLSQLTENLIVEIFYIDWKIVNNYSPDLKKHIYSFPRITNWNPAYDVCNGLKELIELDEKSKG
jgi:hypothetical protein